MSEIVQSILIPRKLYTKTEANNWVYQHAISERGVGHKVAQHYTLKKLDITTHFFRYRQIDPQYLKRKYPNGYFRNKMLDNGIYIILYFTK